MSTPSTQAPNPVPTSPAPAPVQPAAAPLHRRQIIIISHSNLFYWWPVWALGFLLTIISYFGDWMVTVPKGTESRTRVEVANFQEPRDVLVLPSPEKIKSTKDTKDAKDYKPLLMHVSSSKNVGVLFVVVLLLVIVITNIPLRGIWSFVVILCVFFLTVIFAIMDWWRIIFDVFGFLDIRINMAGYLVISGILFVLWLIVVFFFDRQIYMVFEPGQLRVRQSIGDAETSYDTTGMTTQKQRSDLFRHWVLGLGSGDLIVKTAGAHPTTIDMNNVLFVGRKHREIEELLRSREVVSGGQ